MEPALVIVAAAGAVFLLHLIVQCSFDMARAVVGLRWSLPGFVSDRLAVVLTVVTLGSVMRLSDASAATPPPYVRVAPQVPESAGPPDPPEESATSPETGLIALEPQLEGSARSHTVERGDCLWRIARAVLGESGVAQTGSAITEYWQAIYRMNREVIGPDPNLIHPGQILILPEV